jgi:hypothetical protein
VYIVVEKCLIWVIVIFLSMQYYDYIQLHRNETLKTIYCYCNIFKQLQLVQRNIFLFMYYLYSHVSLWDWFIIWVGLDFVNILSSLSWYCVDNYYCTLNCSHYTYRKGSLVNHVLQTVLKVLYNYFIDINVYTHDVQ